ncbi:MAG: carboxypeptidase regulatory-like domain-containing protein [Chitinispirillaceae bacterium]|nr:carboxypeptidase regulatory-like domain-containing protein [Chitinispirillaceae bacterium]
MHRTVMALTALLFAASIAPAQTVSLSGTVKKTGGTGGIQGVKVSLANLRTLSAVTNAAGAFTISGATMTKWQIPRKTGFRYTLENNSVVILSGSGLLQGTIELYAANGQKTASVPLKGIAPEDRRVLLPKLRSGLTVLRIVSNGETVTRTIVRCGDLHYVRNESVADGALDLAKHAGVGIVDTIIASKAGYRETKMPVDSYDKQNIAISLDTSLCVLPNLPDPSGLIKVNAKLPDPFTFYDGTKLTRKEQWACRRAEILAMAGKYLYGPMPPDPNEITGSVSGSSISATVKVGLKSQNLSWATSGSGDRLFMTIGGFGGMPAPTGCRTLGLSHNAAPIANLYGYTDITATISIAWQAKIICAVIDKNPAAGINPDKICVTGCSGAGKVCMTTGAFCEGIDLTLIVESGGGGASSFRMCEWYRHGSGGSSYQCTDKPQGIDNLEDNGLAGPWVAQAANWVRRSPSKVVNLPFDQHLVLACIAPRAVCHVTNQHGPNEWCHLGGTCEALSAWAAEPVWNALGVPYNFGFRMYSESGAPGHCSNPASATALAREFYKRVLEGNTGAVTDVWEAKDQDLQQPKSQWPSMWVDWNMNVTLQ